LEFEVKASPTSTKKILMRARIAKAKANVLNYGSVSMVVTCMRLDRRRMLKMKLMIRIDRVIFILWTKLAVG